MYFGSTIRLNKVGFCFLALVIVIFILYSLQNKSNNVDGIEFSLQELLLGSIHAAIEGGIKVVTIFNSSNLNTKTKGKTKEGANNPVTDADIMSHCTMYYGLASAFPGVHIISEEQVLRSDCNTITDFKQSSFKLPDDLPGTLVSVNDLTVWIDPLDATQEFTEGLVEYVTTMVCVAVKGEPTLGIIHFPFSKTTLWSWYGYGSNIIPTKHQDKLVVITSRSHKGDVSNIVTNVLQKNFALVQAGGAGYKSIQIATGNASVYVHATEIKKWDICAGDAVIKTLGGEMKTLKGEAINYDSSSNVVNKNGLVASLKTYAKVREKFTTADLPT